MDVAIIKDVDSARAVPLLDSKGNDLPWDFLDRRLVAGRQLKGHQREGISWLWQHYLSGHKGVLLADDMGLGKTLQIACFLTLLREFGRGDVRQRPILVVCPVILLANWKREIETSFTEALLVPEILEARELVVLSRNGFLAQKIEREHQSIFLLSYETMARHQRELLKVNWASVVFDEGHYLKNPTTFRTLAARGFKRDFGICLTGTPVENRLLDLWSLFDCVSPGVPFGSAKDFIGRYEEAEGGTVDLRAQLRYPSRDSPLLRRDRATHLPDLPPVREQTHLLPMTAEQVQMEEEVVKNNRSILKILGNLQKLYQHPRLLGRSGPSPKLAKTIEILRDIRARGEKAIVFTLWVEMQKLLAESIEDELQIDPVGIVNGDSNAAGTADATLARFRATRGFDVIILSPLAAGTGLTITEANHVIHYGRWWNPAKEDQATGRAYRLGQKKEVFVHYPLLHHPASIDRGFDVSLHKLVEKKRALATDFLRPTMLGDISRSEFDSVLGRDKK